MIIACDLLFDQFQQVADLPTVSIRSSMNSDKFRLYRHSSAASTAGDTAASARLLVIVELPICRAVRRRDLHGRHLVFRAVRRPVGEVGGDDIRLRVRVMEGRVDDARRDPVGNQRPQRRLAGAAGELHPVAVANAALLGVVRMDFQPVLGMPDDVFGAPRLRADIVLAEECGRWSVAAGSAVRCARRSRHIRCG